MRTTRPTTSATSILLALALDAALVLGFAAAGLASHGSGVLSAGGMAIATTAMPFLVALMLGWLVGRLWRAPLAPIRTGLPIWLVTLTGGMLLRFATGQGTALPFVIVAALTLLVLLVGWRAAASSLARRHARGRTEA
ncbi:DUF3054 domain-containing protein [Agrococcus sp. ProA11]|uniref:DUF3054 domain-containing protein n=1 Tax=Agrococcus chionoecetis TaxID=3153752 RepID=UPI0032607715